ncbi:phosphatase PAP2 family protein [Mesorhizobium intechi]|uniref:phosphatase PAP2 family protein n=1 Tax=Mesorhizobium intechi TaxID=537601 RepID=UPI000CC672BF|nr:phosphatase PAP2 family protein [Mesorhizobium intechi]TSE07576.1 phosphatase PAP2 family protein [Mesorhizobium intechi]
MPNRPIIVLSFGLTALVAALDIAWLPFSKIHVDTSNVSVIAKLGLGMVLLYGISVAVSLRVGNDKSLLGQLIGRLAYIIRSLIGVTMLSLPFGIAFGIFICLASSTGRELVDAQLAAIDRAVGFDWLAFLSAMNGDPIVSKVLVLAYHTAGLQVLALLISYAAMQRADRMIEFTVLNLVCLTITGILVAFFPAAGAYAYFNPPPGAYNNFTEHAGMWHYSTLLKLRSGDPFTLFLDDPQPLVTFPSYHTAVGIFVAWSARGFRFFWPVAALEAVMILSTLPEGGHHLVDVVAGGIVAVLAIVAVAGIESAKRPMLRPAKAPR